MRVGLSLAAHFEPGASAAAGCDDVMRQVELAEAAGFDAVFLGHHYLTRSAFLQPLTLAAFIAARTTRIRIGFGVYLLPLHGPVALAEELATLDVLSGGRLIAGFGAGYRRTEYRALGLPFAERFRRLDEAVPLLRRLWAGETVTAAGAFGELRDAQLHLRPLQPGGPPVWIGAFGPAGIRRAAALDAAWLAPPDASLADLAERLALYRAALRGHGYDEARRYPLLRAGFVASSRERAVDAIRPYLAAQYEGYRGWKHGLEIDQLLADRAIVGPPETVVAQLQAFAALGVTDVILRMQWMGMDGGPVRAAIRLLGEEVLPAFRAAREVTPRPT